jgi:formyltetrahydrofolate deformylase
MRTAIFVSKYDHCLLEILYRHRTGELPCEIVAVVSNHPHLGPQVASFNIPFHVFPITPDTKREQEDQELSLLRSLDAELIVLARYMQVLTASFVDNYPNRIINIHHSFLPAFVGKKPYEQAHERGVKLIGATSHYVTAGLDEGPIIDQDVCRVTHRDSVEELVRKGRELERQVLGRSVRLHLLHRVLPYGRKTVVFD